MKRVRLIENEVSLDLIARRVVMASVIYYGLDQSIVSDQQFDHWCKKLYRLWFRLDNFRQWQLGSREEIITSGFHVKVTWASLGGTTSWLESLGLSTGPIVPIKDWQWSKKRQVHYLSPSDFKYVQPLPRKRIKL
jgi:hypothetical protein